ncbi:hypothetical protein TNCV_302441 [Trichonephila clavipes]|nr:hypothetical protein TNCV_302441 [Trichonephila clavipes]
MSEEGLHFFVTNEQEEAKACSKRLSKLSILLKARRSFKPRLEGRKEQRKKSVPDTALNPLCHLKPAVGFIAGRVTSSYGRELVAAMSRVRSLVLLKTYRVEQRYSTCGPSSPFKWPVLCPLL